MAQKRKPPAFQEYSAEILANLSFREMTLQDRGLFCTMRHECWVNTKMPKDPYVLARVLGFPANQVIASLPAVMSFFEIDGENIVCPELENYRKHLEDRNRKLSDAGKKGAEKTNKMSYRTTSNDVSATPQPPRRLGRGPLVKSSTEKQSQVQLSKEKDTCLDSFVTEMEEYETEEAILAHGDVNDENKEFVRIR